ncbi:MAG: hypothetical protein U0841_22895 [Chloroflexia bacterium]
MAQDTATATATGPQPGELIADFSGRTADGRIVWRRDYKGKRHLILCFAAPLPDPARQLLLAALAARHDAILAAGANLVTFWPADPPAHPTTILADPDNRIHPPLRRIHPAPDHRRPLRRNRPAPPPRRPPRRPPTKFFASVEWMQLRCSV